MSRPVLASILTLGMILLVGADALAGGRYGCRKPQDVFDGDYVIEVVPSAESQVRVVEQILTDLRTENPQVYQNSRFVVKGTDASTLPAVPSADAARTLVIGVGETASLQAKFEKIKVRSGVAIASYDRGVAPMPEEEYYRGMLTHALYRGLLQLNGEEAPGVSEVTLEHLIAANSDSD